MTDSFMPSPFSIPYTSREVNTRAQPGRVFYVDAGSGSNDNSGIRPDEAFLSITYALTQVRVDANDYIIVLVSGETAWPVTITAAHSRVHILGSTNPPGLGQYLSPFGVEDESAFYLHLCDTVEIAGFNLGAGNTHGCIELGTCQRNWFHHNWFGNSQQGLGTPLYGLDATAGGNQGFLTCEDNLFLGNKVNVGQGISSNGIEIESGAWMTIRRNRFMGCTIGIRLNGGAGNMVLDNVFACPDAAGAAITLRAHAGCVGNMITGNVAMEGAETAMVANPFEDENNNDLNHFGDNRCTLVAGAIDLAHLPA